MYFVFAFVGAAIIINLWSVVWAFWRRHRLAKGEHTPPSRTKGEHAPPSSNGQVRLGRLPAAVLTASRIVAFRLRIPAVNLYLLEILLSSFYLMALMLWTFCNSKWAYLLGINLSFILRTYSAKSEYHGILRSDWPHCRGSTACYRRARDEE